MSYWLRRFVLVGGLLCGLAPFSSAQGLSPGMGMFPEDSTHASGQYGVFSLAVRRAIGSGLCGATDRYCAFQVTPEGALHTSPVPLAVTAANNSGTCVAVTTSNTTILASFATRKWASIVNQGTALVYVKFAATAASTTYRLPAGAAFNWPSNVIYTGIVDGISSSGTNDVCVTEW